MTTEKQLFSVFDSETGDVSVEKLFTFLYNQLPSVYSINFAINLQSVLKKINNKYGLTEQDYLLKLEESCKDDWLKVNYNRSAYLIKIKEQLLLFISANKAEIFYLPTVDFQEVRELVKSFKIRGANRKAKKNFYLLKSEDGDYGLKPIEVNDFDFDLTLYYNDDFLDFHKSVENFLEDNKKSGIVLIYGKPGTGKTSYLKYLFARLNKKFIVIPKRMFGALENPNFYFYVSELHDSVIVLEDCDNLLSSIGKGSAVAEFLKNAEGLLSNGYKYKIICTLSLQKHQINMSYIQKAQNVLQYEMRELDVEKANTLRAKLNLPGKVSKPTILAQVLKPDLGSLKTRKLGFNS